MPPGRPCRTSWRRRIENTAHPPTHALSAGSAYAFILNFWQRYASYATAAPEACVANKGHAGNSVAKLCFLIGKIILPVTHKTINPLDPLPPKSWPHGFETSFGRKYRFWNLPLWANEESRTRSCHRENLFRCPKEKNLQSDSMSGLPEQQGFKQSSAALRLRVICYHVGRRVSAELDERTRSEGGRWDGRWEG